MSTNSWTCEIESMADAARLFKAAVLDWHNLAPKIAPQVVISASSVKGDGNTRRFNFSPAMPFSYVKERFDFVDHEKLECKTTLLEGGGIGIMLESASSQIKFEQKNNGGCVCQVITTYKLLPGVELKDESEAAKQSFMGAIKGAEAYLLANPDAYN